MQTLHHVKACVNVKQVLKTRTCKEHCDPAGQNLCAQLEVIVVCMPREVMCSEHSDVCTSHLSYMQLEFEYFDTLERRAPACTYLQGCLTLSWELICMSSQEFSGVTKQNEPKRTRRKRYCGSGVGRQELSEFKDRSNRMQQDAAGCNSVQVHP